MPLHQLPAANSLNITIFQAGAIAGPLVGGVLIPFVGFSWLYLVDSITLLATLSAVVRLPRLPVEGATRTPGLRSVVEGLAYLRGHPVLLMSFVVDLIAMVFGMPRALFPEIAHTAFHGPEGGGLAFALLFAAIPAGAVLGGIFSGWVSRVERQGLAVIVCILLWGAAMVGFGVAVALAERWQEPMLVAAVLMLVLGGAADMASSAFRNSMLMTAATDAVRGRLQGVFIVVVAGGPRIADVVHGAGAAAVGTAAAAAGGGVLVIIGTVVAALAVPSFVRYRITQPVRRPGLRSGVAAAATVTSCACPDPATSSPSSNAAASSSSPCCPAPPSCWATPSGSCATRAPSSTGSRPPGRRPRRWSSGPRSPGTGPTNW